MPNHHECAHNLHSPPYCNCDLCIDGNHKENHNTEGHLGRHRTSAHGFCGEPTCSNACEKK